MLFERILVLIDADNVADSLWPRIDTAVRRLGTPHRFLAASNSLRPGWASIKAVDLEVLTYTVPDGTDYYLAMRLGELLVEERPDALALVSSDGDFEALFHAARQRRLGTIAIYPLTDTAGATLNRIATAADLCLVLPYEAAAASRKMPVQKTPVQKIPLPALDPRRILQELDRMTTDADPWCSRTALREHLAKSGLAISRQRLMKALKNSELFELSLNQQKVRRRVVCDLSLLTSQDSRPSRSVSDS